MDIISNAPRRVRILYVGRSVTAFNTLRDAILHQDTTLHESGTDNGATPTDAPADMPIPQPSVQFERARNQKQAMVCVREQPPHIVLVEVTGAPNSRVRFCETVRYRLPTAKIVAMSKEAVTCPFPFDGTLALPLVLSATREMICTYIEELEGRQLQLGHILLDATRRTVQTHSGVHHMTPKQCALLKLLMMHHGTVVARTDIMQAIWDTSYMEDTRTLDVHIRWLREHIEPDPSEPIYLTTVRGKGYRLDV